MPIDFERFLNWAEKSFDNVVVKGNEIKLNSPFANEDHKHHLWCNPRGGKKGEGERPYGVYRCWKTDKRGTLVGLVMHVDKCTFEDALETLGAGDTNLALLEAQLEQMFEEKTNQQKEEKQRLDEIRITGIPFPPHTYKISDLDPNNFFRTEAEIILHARKIPYEKFYVCTAGDFKNRIVIPYYDRNGKLIYYNARDMGKSKTKYMGPDKSIGIGKGDVVYMCRWPVDGTKIHICEGEFNAESLVIAGFEGGAFGGKSMSELQAEMIRPYIPVICVYNDKAGLRALPSLGEFMRSHGFPVIHYVRPPLGYKDWNEMLIKLGAKLLRLYVLSNEKIFDDFTADKMRINL